MTDLINGRCPAEIKRWISSRVKCETCPQDGLYGCEYGERTEDCQMCIDTLAFIERLESQRDAALAKVPKWISVEERLPPPETERYLAVSVCKGGHRITNTAVWAWDENDEKGEWIKWDPVTHWMPMPEPPEEDAYG